MNSSDNAAFAVLVFRFSACMLVAPTGEGGPQRRGPMSWWDGDMCLAGGRRYGALARDGTPQQRRPSHWEDEECCLGVGHCVWSAYTTVALT